MQEPVFDVVTDSKAAGAPAISLRDIATLAKPRITLMVVITAAGGLFLSRRAADLPAPPSLSTILSTLIGTALIVAGANALNMYIERDIDRRMDRTKNRPLPAGRMSPRVALWFGVTVSAVSVPILAIGANPLTALLAVLANLLYVLAYTPLKQHSHWALHVGAIPGAIPPLLAGRRERPASMRLGWFSSLSSSSGRSLTSSRSRSSGRRTTPAPGSW